MSSSQQCGAAAVLGAVRKLGAKAQPRLLVRLQHAAWGTARVAQRAPDEPRQQQGRLQLRNRLASAARGARASEARRLLARLRARPNGRRSSRARQADSALASAACAAGS
jgi:hypothetical protein